MPHKLLLADDSVTIQRVIELTFADEDVQVLTAGDGEQAIEKIQSDRPDIVLADIGMPKRSGYDVAAFVKGAPDLAHIPVLLLTGAFEPVDEQRAQAAGCDGVLVKPFEPQHVIARVRELLQGAGRGPGAAPVTNVTRAVADVPRPAERLMPRPSAPRPSIAPPPGDEPREASDLDDYFDRLDAAFANIASTPDAPVRPADINPRHDGPVMERDLDAFDSPSHASAQPSQHPLPPPAPLRDYVPPPARMPAQVPEPVPVTLASPPGSPAWPVMQPPSVEPPDAAAERSPQPAQPSQSGSSSQPTASGGRIATASLIADAFSALLAAEQGEADAAPVRLPIAGTPVMTDELVEAVAERVIERLGSRVGHDVVADIVSRVAERLVRQEIERIRHRSQL
jgi:CheY-like chemotaxis protein